MTIFEFAKKMRELDPFHAPTDEETPFDVLYERYKTIVAEFERLEDIEDNTIQMKAEIDLHRENIKKIKEMISKCKGV